MKPTTDIEQVKSVARALLMTEVYKTPYSPMVVQHPFTSSGFVATTKDGVMQLIDITESVENLQAWQNYMKKQINSTDNAYEIYMMTNKPYSLTFLKYASPYLSKADFSKILADAWIRSKNPNCDTNVSKSKLISMFKQADPHELMLEDELRQYEELDDTVTVYRGVTSHNAKNIKALSWTLDREKAEWFAHRFNEDGTVYEAEIDKQHILALFNGRNESEVIVDPKFLMDIRISEEPRRVYCLCFPFGTC
jgi:hypothetical protein